MDPGGEGAKSEVGFGPDLQIPFPGEKDPNVGRAYLQLNVQFRSGRFTAPPLITDEVIPFVGIPPASRQVMENWDTRARA